VRVRKREREGGGKYEDCRVVIMKLRKQLDMYLLYERIGEGARGSHIWLVYSGGKGLV
jgi:hypothetical protein